MLTSFHIKNFRSCKDVKLAGLGPMLGLVGRNGAGKTTILRAIKWAAATALISDDFVESFAEADTRDMLGPLVRVELELRVEGQGYRYTVGQDWADARMGGPQTIVPVETLEVLGAGPGASEMVFGRVGSYIPEARLRLHAPTAMLPALASILAEDDPRQVHVRRAMKALVGVHYYPGHGIFDPDAAPSAETNGPVPVATYDKWAEARGRSGREHTSLSYRLIHANQTAPEVFAELKSRLGPDGLGLLSDLYVITLGDVSDKGRGPSYYDVVFRPLGHAVELSLNQLSGGTRQMLYLMLALLLDQSSTMLVEQPEDGIHPALLAKLIDLFRVNADPTQIVLASHSPTVLSSLRPDEVRLVEIAEGATRVRALTADEVQRAEAYMQREGSLAEFLELLQED